MSKEDDAKKLIASVLKGQPHPLNAEAQLLASKIVDTLKDHGYQKYDEPKSQSHTSIES